MSRLAVGFLFLIATSFFGVAQTKATEVFPPNATGRASYSVAPSPSGTPSASETNSANVTTASNVVKEPVGISPTPLPSPSLRSNASSFVQAAEKSAAGEGMLTLFFYFFVLLLLAVAAFYLMRNGWSIATWKKQLPRKLQITEMRALGNRQFLVVVEYDNTRLLLGVSPGRIDHLYDLTIREADTPDFSKMMGVESPTSGP